MLIQPEQAIDQIEIILIKKIMDMQKEGNDDAYSKYFFPKPESALRFS